MRAVAYIRVSDASQVEGHSLDAQERLFRQLCEQRGWEPVRVYREEGRSAKSDAIARRPVFRQLLEDAEAKAFDVVVVHTLDRWARNLRVSLETQGMLGRAGVVLVSITEQIDHTTPEGKFMMQMLGGLAELYSGTLAKHVQKGISERVRQGRHLGGVPFGYQPCSLEGCEPEHTGGVHVVEAEAEAVRELFGRYAAGGTTCVQLAAWLNREGHRTLNRHRFGADEAEGRFFTSASVRGILHNPFYAGRVKHRDEVHEGSHEALVSWEVFEQVGAVLARNAGRSRTLAPKPARTYLLKGLVRCAHCGMAMWAQTFQNGLAYYREHRGSRGAGACVGNAGSVRAEVIDAQMGALIEGMVLPEDWLSQALERISLHDEVARVQRERAELDGKLQRLGRAYVDGLVEQADYERQRRQYEFDRSTLKVPQADAVAEAGRLVRNLPSLWRQANLAERHRLMGTVLEAVYVDAQAGRVVRVQAKGAFEVVMGVAASSHLSVRF